MPKMIFQSLMTGIYFSGLAAITEGLIGSTFNVLSAGIGAFLFALAFLSVQLLMMEN